MQPNMAYKHYIENTIFTSSPEELTLILYNGLVKFILQAKLAIERKDIRMAHDCIIKAKRILINFENTLDLKYEVSKHLFTMYEYMMKRLTEANIKKDTAILEESLGLATEMRDTWLQAMKTSKEKLIVNDEDNTKSCFA